MQAVIPKDGHFKVSTYKVNITELLHNTYYMNFGLALLIEAIFKTVNPFFLYVWLL